MVMKERSDFSNIRYRKSNVRKKTNDPSTLDEILCAAAQICTKQERQKKNYNRDQQSFLKTDVERKK